MDVYIDKLQNLLNYKISLVLYKCGILIKQKTASILDKKVQEFYKMNQNHENLNKNFNHFDILAKLHSTIFFFSNTPQRQFNTLVSKS